MNYGQATIRASLPIIICAKVAGAISYGGNSGDRCTKKVGFGWSVFGKGQKSPKVSNGAEKITVLVGFAWAPSVIYFRDVMKMLITTPKLK